MRQLSIFFATVVLTCFAFLPMSAFADDLDDLEVTMEVIDDMNRVEDVMTEMRGPESDDDGDDDDGDETSDEYGDPSVSSLPSSPCLNPPSRATTTHDDYQQHLHKHLREVVERLPPPSEGGTTAMALQLVVQPTAYSSGWTITEARVTRMATATPNRCDVV